MQRQEISDGSAVLGMPMQDSHHRHGLFCCCSCTVGCDSPSGCVRGCMLHCELMMNEGTKRNSSATFVQACHTLLHMQQHYQVAQQYWCEWSPTESPALASLRHARPFRRFNTSLSSHIGRSRKFQTTSVSLATGSNVADTVTVVVCGKQLQFCGF